MISQQGGFKEVIKKAFPEADFSQWSKNPIPCLSFLTTITDPFPRKNKKGSKRERFQEIKNCREEFLHFAQQKGFDPLQTENWYHIKSSQFLREMEVTFHPFHQHTFSSLMHNNQTGSKGDHVFAWWDEECIEVGLS